MQQTFSVKRFALNHLGGTALAFGILVSSLTVVTTLGLSGAFPGSRGAGSAQVAASSITAPVTDAQLTARQQYWEARMFGVVVQPAPSAAPLDQLLATYARYNPEIDGTDAATLATMLAEYARYNPAINGPATDGANAAALTQLLADYGRYNPEP